MKTIEQVKEFVKNLLDTAESNFEMLKKLDLKSFTDKRKMMEPFDAQMVMAQKILDYIEADDEND
jgi:hypothetical protein